MNNSKISYNKEKLQDKVSFLENRRSELVQVIEAIKDLEQNDAWIKLKRVLLDGVVVTLEKQLSNEATKKEVDTPELYRLQGQLAWARKYCDLKKLAEFFKQQVDNINSQLYEKNPRDGAL